MEMSFVDTLISAVQNLFEFLFGSFPELKKKQELHKISVRLKSMLPPMYRNDGFLLPAFASALYQFFQFLQPLRKNLYATIANPDKRIADRCREFVLETALTPEEKKLRLSLLYPDRLNELLKNTKNTAAVLAEQEKKFIQYIRLTENENFKKSASVLEELFLLRDLCDFNFQGILFSFDPVFQILPENDGQNEENSGQNPDAAGEPEKAPRQPNFQSIPVSELAPQLLDLNFLMQDVNLSHDVEEAMLLLSAFMQKTQVTADMQTQFNRIFQSVSWQMTNRISAEFLLDIIKLEQRNPDFIPQNPEREKTDFIRLYQDRLKEIFQSDSKKLIQSIRKNETEKLIEQIFGKIPLESHAVFQTGTGGARAFDLRPAEKTLNIRLTRGNVRQIADLLPAELFAYSDLFMAPVLTGEQLSENEYTALIGAAYGPRAEQEMREAVFTLTAECPAAVTEATALIQTGAGFQDAPDIQVETNGGQVCFRIPVARLLCLTQPVSLSVRWQ